MSTRARALDRHPDAQPEPRPHVRGRPARPGRGPAVRTAARLDPGGKGVNVARALLPNGRAVRAVLPCGGAEGEQLLEPAREAEGVDRSSCASTGRTRSNVTLAEPDGTVTKINEPGPALTAAEVDGAARRPWPTPPTRADWVVACGSLPPGVDRRAARRNSRRRVRDRDGRVAVDTSGEPLASAARGGTGPGQAEPRRARRGSSGVPSRPSATSWTRRTRSVARGAEVVLASLGADGALLVDADGHLHAERSCRAPAARSAPATPARRVPRRRSTTVARPRCARPSPAAPPPSRCPARRCQAPTRSTPGSSPCTTDRHGTVPSPATTCSRPARPTAATPRLPSPPARPLDGPWRAPVTNRETNHHDRPASAAPSPMEVEGVPESSVSAATSPRWSCPTSARSSPGA